MSEAQAAQAHFSAPAAARRAYSAASPVTAEIGWWSPANMSADAEILVDGPAVRAKARELVRNNPMARQAVRIRRLAVVGAKFRLNLTPDYQTLGIDPYVARQWSRYVRKEWERYAHSPQHWVDSGRRMSFTEMMGLAHDCDYTDGECLITAEWAPDRPWATCFQVVDVDRLSNPHRAPDTEYRRGGVDLGPLGEPIAYNIRESHPGDGVAGLSLRSHTWRQVPRETPWWRPIVMHTFRHQRPAQTRGISEFASVIETMAMGDKYARTELANAIVQASYAAVLTSQMDMKEATEAIAGAVDQAGACEELTGVILQHLADTADYYKESNITFNGVRIPKLIPGDKLEFVSPGHPSQQYADFQHHNDRRSAAGLGVDPSGMTQNYSDVNYSSARASHANNWRGYEECRARLINQAAMPAFSAWFEEAVASGRVILPNIPTEAFFQVRDHLTQGTFLTAGRPLIDPVKERQAQQIGVQIGALTLADICAQEGEDWEEKAEQRAAEVQLYDDLGLPPPNLDPFNRQMSEHYQDGGDGSSSAAPDDEEDQ